MNGCRNEAGCRVPRVGAKTGSRMPAEDGGLRAEIITYWIFSRQLPRRGGKKSNRKKSHVPTKRWTAKEWDKGLKTAKGRWSYDLSCSTIDSSQQMHRRMQLVTMNATVRTWDGRFLYLTCSIDGMLNRECLFNLIGQISKKPYLK